MVNTLGFFGGILLLNIITHALLSIVNVNKSDSDNPLMFKIFYYFLLFNINIIIFLIGTFTLNILNSTLIYSYLTVTIPLISIHFILDEDWVFRFDKAINMLSIFFLIIIFYSLWYVLVLK